MATQMAPEKTDDTEPQNPAVDAAYIAGQVYAGCGDETDPRSMLALMTMIEAFICGGEDFANAKMGWTVQTTPATVTTLEIVRKKPTPIKPRPTDK